jgi:hypothetical protein
VHYVIEARAFAPQFLSARGVIPDIGILQFAGYFFQALALGGVVKDTP